MKVLGIDPSSSVSSLALVEGKELLKTWLWVKDKSKSDAQNLFNYYEWVKRVVNNPFGGTIAPMACVEFLRVTRNAEASRKISHYQAASVIACKESGIVIIEAAATSARKEALGKGNLSKEEVHAAIKAMFPDFKFKASNRGGMDETDATVLGLAGPGLAER